MASENETVDEVLRCIQNDIVHFVGKPVKHSRDLLQEYHDRFKAAHQREVGELCGERNGILNANASLAADNDRLRREVDELKHWIKSAARWIKCHDIYHTSGDYLIKQAKEILNDNGEFLFKKEE